MGDFDAYQISNQDLREADVPGPKAEWEAVEKFALSFDGYEHHGSSDTCADIANRCEAAYQQDRTLPDTLDDLRTCLFFEQRRWRHFGQEPDPAAMRYIDALLTKLRNLVRPSPSSGKRTTQEEPELECVILRPLPASAHRDSGRQKRVLIYRHDSEQHEQHRWTLDQLSLLLQRESPSQDGDPDRTFIVGGTRRYLAISTAGVQHFTGQHPLWSATGKIEGAMLFNNLTIEDVWEILEKFYAGRSAEGCFAPYDGRFEFYRRDQSGTAPR